MITITNKVISKDGDVIKDNVTYALNYVISNGILTSVQCAISTDINGIFEQIGFVRQENGRITTDFKDDVSLLKYLTVYETILKEIEADEDIIKPMEKPIVTNK